MKKRYLSLILLIFTIFLNFNYSFGQKSETAIIIDEYINEWKQFYPFRAYSLGFLNSLFDFDNFSLSNIQAWLQINRDTLDRINSLYKNQSHDSIINGQLLKAQIKSEIQKWEIDAPHTNSLSFYTRPIYHVIPRILDSKIISAQQRYRTVLKGLICINGILRAADKMAGKSIKTFNPDTLNKIKKISLYYKKELPNKIKNNLTHEEYQNLLWECQNISKKLKALAKKMKKEATPFTVDKKKDILGKETYIRKLKIYTDSNLSPEQLEERSLKEIHQVLDLIAKEARAYLMEAYPNHNIPVDFNQLVQKVFKEMEAYHPTGREEYLKFWKNLASDVEGFIRKNKIVTLPKYQTLNIELVPESAGPRARIGYVQPAPPFHPNPWTTLYLPSIPDSFPQNERDEFWRSFNNYFNKFIVIHELFPGHYIQNKIARENPYIVRKLFPYKLYSEGWASLCEEIILDAGWDNKNKLTRLAHLRKRLENANRAYMSVQVHCNNWDEKKVLDFSINTSLLAPQFAKSLWGRLIRSPMQIISYFLGTQQFQEIYRAEKKRLGDKFSTIDFMDTILRAGPIPIDEFSRIFKESYPLQK